MKPRDPALILEGACEKLLCGEVGSAASLLSAKLPLEEPARETRRYSKPQLVGLFTRDRFTDRYSGNLLVFPGVLLVLSQLVPKEFPYHPNWKFGACHQLYWQLYPTLDHVVPLSRGGRDQDSNWVTTSMLRNSLKGSWSLDELGWQLQPIRTDSWDGLIGLFSRLVRTNPSLLEVPAIAQWRAAARAVQQAAEADGRGLQTHRGRGQYEPW